MPRPSCSNQIDDRGRGSPSAGGLIDNARDGWPSDVIGNANDGCLNDGDLIDNDRDGCPSGGGLKGNARDGCPNGHGTVRFGHHEMGGGAITDCIYK